MKTSSRRFGNERGIVLVIALLILALLMGAGVGAIVSTQTDFKSSGNFKRGTQAFYIAEAGVNHAQQKVQTDTQTGTGTSFDCLYSNSCDPQIISSTNFYEGTYTVSRQGSRSTPVPSIKIVSEGTAPNNAKAVIEAWFKKEAGKPKQAILTDGDLKISGNAKLLGICGGAHSNDDMQITGNPAVQMANGLNSSNAPGGGGPLAEGMNITGTPCIGSADCGGSNPPAQYKLDTAAKRDSYEAANGSDPTQYVPKINPADYAPKVAAMGSDANHYILHDDGTVTKGGSCVANGLCSGGSPVVPAPTGWNFSGGKWKVAGNIAGLPLPLSLPVLEGTGNGVFYSETDVEVGGNPGSVTNPWLVTIISRGSIEVSGNPNIQPYPTSSTDLQNHFFVAGNDLEITGSVTADSAGGVVLVHQQFKLGGNSSFKLNGYMIAGDGQPTWSGDPFPSASGGSAGNVNEISNNNVTVTYNCDVMCTGPGCPPPTVTTVSWANKF